jgi:triacylglycerol esterase/lipase EstA (alpha/beta hydrolase family)
MTAAAVVLLGAPAGLLWSALAPHSQVVVTAGEGFIADAESEVFIAGDGWFVGITLLAGVLAGALAWLVARRSGPFVVVGLAVGGVVAAYVASRVGVQIGRDELLATVRSGRDGTYVGNVALQAKSAVAVWPLGAMAAFAALVASRVDELE